MTIVGWALLMRAYAMAHGQGFNHTSSLVACFTTMGRIGSGISGFLLASLVALPSIPLTIGLGAIMLLGSLTGAALLIAIGRLSRIANTPPASREVDAM